MSTGPPPSIFKNLLFEDSIDCVENDDMKIDPPDGPSPDCTRIDPPCPELDEADPPINIMSPDLPTESPLDIFISPVCCELLVRRDKDPEVVVDDPVNS
jgi:hypothetical protein